MTLTQAAQLTKKGILYLTALIFASFFVWAIYNVGQKIYLQINPPIEKPNLKFGALPKIQFPDSNISSSGFTYSIDTSTGNLPTAPRIIKVYFMPRNGVSLLAPDKVASLAHDLGFANGPQLLSQTEYQFDDGTGNVMTVDLASGNFHLQRQPQLSKSSSGPTQILDQDKLVRSFKDYLSSNNLLMDDLNEGKTSVTLSGTSPADSDTANISIWPADVDDLPIVTPAFKTSLVRATIGKDNLTNKFLKVDYIYWPIDKTTFATYPLITTQEAYNKLTQGQGYVSFAPNTKQISISDVSLAYYQSENYSPYLQPVFVFKGPNFTALVPAIKY